MSTTSAARKLRASLRAVALSYPEAREEFPWGESVIKVKGKIFIFLGREEDAEVGFGLKLPDSGGLALALPGITPTGYGLGKSGWVSIKLGAGDELPFDLLHEWLDESYRTVAPKKLVAALKPAATTAPAPNAKAAMKTKVAAKPAPKLKSKPATKTKAGVGAKRRPGAT